VRRGHHPDRGGRHGLNRAPGRGRHFAFEHYRDFDAHCGNASRPRRRAKEKPLRKLPIFGSDQDRWVLDKAKNNLVAAGYADVIEPASLGCP